MVSIPTYDYFYDGRQFSLIRISAIIKNSSTESFKYYAWPQMAVTRGLHLPTSRLAGRQTAAASKHSLCYFSLFSE